MAAGSAGMLLHISPSLSAITLSVVPAMILGAGAYSRVVKRLSRELLDALASSTQVGYDTEGSIVVVVLVLILIVLVFVSLP
jgi:ATP-binding cassette subfamily B protein